MHSAFAKDDICFRDEVTCDVALVMASMHVSTLPGQDGDDGVTEVGDGTDCGIESQIGTMGWSAGI